MNLPNLPLDLQRACSLLAMTAIAATPSAAATSVLTCSAAPGPSQELGPPITIESQLDADTRPVPIDIDHDGDLDLVCFDRDVTSGEAGLFVFENLGNQRFDILRPIAAEISEFSFGTSLGAHDFDGDGKSELFLLTYNDQFSRPELLRYSLTAHGELVLDDTQSLSGVFGGRNFRFEDINGDGAADLVFEDRLGLVGTWVGLREPGGFNFVDLGAPYAGNDFVGLADFNGDGLQDQIARTAPREVSMVLQTAPGVFGSPTVIDDNALETQFNDSMAADFNGDGRLDPLIVHTEMRGIVVYRGLAGGGFGARMRLAGSESTTQVVIDDADGDGDPDLLLPGITGVLWIENLGGFQFAEPLPLVSPGELFPVALTALTDLNGDDRDDVIAVGFKSTFVALRTSAALAESEVQVLINFRLDADFVVAANLDGDQDLDLVTGPLLSVAENRGPGRFETPRPIFESLGSVSSIATGDLDGDGLEDLVVTANGGQLVWLRNLGQGQLDEIFVASADLKKVSVQDMDLDGDLDIVSMAPMGAGLQVHLQGPVGVFTGSLFLPSPAGEIRDFEIADFSGDGRPDAAWAQVPSSTYAVLWSEQNDDGTWSPGATLAATADRDGFSFVAADLDGSGFVDLAWLSDSTREIIASRNVGGVLEPANAIGVLTGNGISLAARPLFNGLGASLVASVERPAQQNRNRVELLRRSGTSFSYSAPVTITEALDFPGKVLSVDLDGDADQDLAVGGSLAWHKGLECSSIGELYCPGVAANSTGRKGELEANGSPAVADGDLRLVASDLPPSSLTLFITSQARDVVPNAGGAAGTLCLGGEIGRFGLPGQAGATNADGQRRLTVDLLAMPQPMGVAQVLVGEEWCFQAWHRDSTGGGTPTSNFSDAIAVRFE